MLEKTLIQLQAPSTSFVIGRCWSLKVDAAGYLAIRFNKIHTISLLVKELDINLAIAEVLNIRKEAVIDPVGQLALRAECIRDLKTWKQKTLRILKMRLTQLNRLLEECRSTVPTDISTKVFIRSSVSERAPSRRFSFYEPSEIEVTGL